MCRQEAHTRARDCQPGAPTSTHTNTSHQQPPRHRAPAPPDVRAWPVLRREPSPASFDPSWVSPPPENLAAAAATTPPAVAAPSPPPLLAASAAALLEAEWGDGRVVGGWGGRQGTGSSCLLVAAKLSAAAACNNSSSPLRLQGVPTTPMRTAIRQHML